MTHHSFTLAICHLFFLLILFNIIHVFCMVFVYLPTSRFVSHSSVHYIPFYLVINKSFVCLIHSYFLVALLYIKWQMRAFIWKLGFFLWLYRYRSKNHSEYQKALFIFLLGFVNQNHGYRVVCGVVISGFMVC